jgi:hypothetical protein
MMRPGEFAAESRRWLLVPMLAIAACATLWVAAGVAGDGLRRAFSAEALEAAIPLDVRYGLVNAAAAIAFVVAGAMIAPRARILVALVLYAVGAAIAWFVLDAWSFPEGHPRAYQFSRVPLMLTLLGGLAGVLVPVLLRHRSRVGQG